MKTIRDGHRYELENHQNKEQPGQIIQFIEKEPDGTGQFVVVKDGTTNEEVLKVLIDRMTFLYNKLPSIETHRAINCCREALMKLDERTQKRVSRGVEGKPLA